MESIPSFETIYTTYQPYIQRVIRATIYHVSPEQVEDLTQETFLRAWKGCAQCDGRNVQAWLARIARNLAIDTLRHERVVRRFLHPITEEVQEERIADPHLSFEDLPSTLSQLMQHLPPKEQHLLALAAQDYSRRDIAARSGLSYSACCKRLRAARRHLRLLYQQGNELAERDLPALMKGGHGCHTLPFLANPLSR